MQNPSEKACVVMAMATVILHGRLQAISLLNPGEADVASSVATAKSLYERSVEACDSGE